MSVQSTAAALCEHCSSLAVESCLLTATERNINQVYGERIVTHVEISHQGLKTEVSGKIFRYVKEFKKNDELLYTFPLYRKEESWKF